MKTPGLLATVDNNRVILKHPHPDLAYSRNSHEGDTEDLHELCEDLERREFLLGCLYTDNTNPLRNLKNKDLITYEIINEKFPSIMKHFGECNASYCPLTREVNPIVRPAIEEIYTEKITKYMTDNKCAVLDIAIYGTNGFLLELLILTRVVRKLKLKKIRLHLINERMGELYNHVKSITSRENTSVDDDNESNESDDSEEFNLSERLVNINDIIDNSDPETLHRKTNHFRIQYSKLCAISEWFSATGYTKCEIFIYKDFGAMSNYTYDVFMGIDFIEDFMSVGVLEQVLYISMISSNLILLAHKDGSMFLKTPYQYARVSVINNTIDKQKRDDIMLTIRSGNIQIISLNDQIKATVKVYKGLVLKDDKYELTDSYFTSHYVKLLNEEESDESIMKRISDSSAEISDCTGEKMYTLGKNDTILIFDKKLEAELDKITTIQAKYIEKQFNGLDIQLYTNIDLYWNVLKTKSLYNALSMIIRTMFGFILTILIVFGVFFETLFRSCTQGLRRLNGERNHFMDNDLCFEHDIDVPPLNFQEQPLNLQEQHEQDEPLEYIDDSEEILIE